jgi:hypothetical protein
MGTQDSRYDVFGVEDFWVSSQDIFDSYGVDVVYQNSIMYLELWMSKIASIITNDYLVSEIEPLSGMVEYLIQITIVTKCVSANATTDLQISIALNERRDSNEL